MSLLLAVGATLFLTLLGGGTGIVLGVLIYILALCAWAIEVSDD